MHLYDMNQSTPSTILVVEDEIILREYLTELLELEGYSTLAAGSATEAVTLLKAHAIRAVITDLHLGQSTGMEVLHHVHTHMLGVPCFVMSAEWNAQIQQQCTTSGAAGLIKKPFDNKELLQVLQTQLNH